MFALGSIFELPVAFCAPLAISKPASAASVAATQPPSPEPQPEPEQQPGLPERLPLIIMSHGLAGNRNTYSSLCAELASHGCLVLSIEHADGTASTARLAARLGRGLPGVWTPSPALSAIPWLGGGGVAWRFYASVGDWSPAAVGERTRWRQQEIRTALRLLTALDAGACVCACVRAWHGLNWTGLDRSHAVEQRGVEPLV